MLCLSCGHINGRESSACAGCGSSLPKRRLPPRLDGALLQLEKAAKDVTMAKITLEQFDSLLDRRQMVCEMQLANIMEMDLSIDLQQEMAEEMALGTAGIQGFLRGIDTMRLYLEDRKFSHLEDGVAEIRESVQLLNQALVLNWMSFYAFQESTEEFITQLGHQS